MKPTWQHAELEWIEQDDGSFTSDTNPVGMVRVWPRGDRWALTFANHHHRQTFPSLEAGMACAQAKHGKWRAEAVKPPRTETTQE